MARAADYGAAMLVTGAALVGGLALAPLLGDVAPALLFTAAVAMSSYRGGLGPGLLAVLLSALMGELLLLSAGQRLAPLGAEVAEARVALFVSLGLLIAALSAALRRARQVAEARLADLERDVVAREAVEMRLRLELAERARTEAALRASDERLRRAVEDAPLPIMIFAEDGEVLTVNEAWTGATGYSPLELRTLADWTTRAYGADQAARVGFARLFTLEGRCDGGEHEIVTSSGERRVWRFSAAPLGHAPDGRRLVVSMALDVTERNQAESELRAANRRLTETLESISDALLTVDRDLVITTVNATAAQLVQREAAALIGRHLWEAFPEAVGTRFQREYEAALAHGCTAHFEALYPPLDAWFEVHAYPSASGLALYFADITQRKRSEQALRASEARFRTLVEALPQIAWTAGADGAVDYYNSRWTEFTGLPAQTGTGWGWRAAVHSEDAERTGTAWEAAVRAGTLYELEHRIRGRDGAYRWHLTRAVPLRDGSGQVTGWIGTATDIDERKRLELERGQLLEAERAARGESERQSRLKDDFVATLSHELRTPLTAILGWTQMLRRGRLGTDETAEALETVERNAHLQKQLIEDLLDMSRIVSGKVRLDFRAFDLGHVVDAALAAIRPSADAKSLVLETHRESARCDVRGDPARIQQVLWNLLTNAVKFTPRGGRVQVRVAPDGERVRVTVTDTGVGITAELLPRIFERFRQGDLATTGRHHGLGLGLAIVKQIVELHGGSVWAQSPGPRQGTTFGVDLPLCTQPPSGEEPLPEMQATATPLPENVRLDDVTVLVVDDEADARHVLRRLLEEYHARVALASSAAEALERLEREPPDVLVSDISMPEEDGYSLIRKVRGSRSERLAALPAIAVTALARDEDRQRAEAAGYQVHLAKPINPAELAAVVARLARPAGCVA